VLLTRGASASATGRPGGGGSPLAPTHSSAGAAAWRMDAVADAANGGLSLSATGEANKTINWVARVMSVETAN
jgi:hypothetical protein